MLTLLAAALLQAPPESRDPWAGFAVGTWAIFLKKDTVDGVVTVKKEKHVLAAGDGDRIRHEVWTETEGAWKRTQIDTHHVPGALPEGDPMKLVSSRQEELGIGAAKIPCSVAAYEGEFPQRKAKISITVWRSADLRVPYRELPKDGADIALMPDVLRADVETSGADRRASYSIRVVERDVKVGVGAREVACVVEELRATEHRGAQKAEGSLRRWLSDEVPGRVARLEFRVTFGEKSQTRTEDVVDAEVKR